MNGRVAKINVLNLTIGLLLVMGAVGYSYTSTVEYQSGYMVKIINTFNSPTIPLGQKINNQVVTEEQVSTVLSSNVGVMNSMDLGGLFSASVKIFIIVVVATLIFITLNTTGLIPRFGACCE